MKNTNRKRAEKAQSKRTDSRRCAVASGSAISDKELNALIHDTMLHELLDQLGAPRKAMGGNLSPFGRLRRISLTQVEVRSALVALVEAEKASRDNFDGKSIERIEQAMQRAERALSPNDRHEPRPTE